MTMFAPTPMLSLSGWRMVRCPATASGRPSKSNYFVTGSRPACLRDARCLERAPLAGNAPLIAEHLFGSIRNQPGDCHFGSRVGHDLLEQTWLLLLGVRGQTRRLLWRHTVWIG